MYLGELIGIIGLGYIGVCLLSIFLSGFKRFMRKLLRALALAYLDSYNGDR